LNLSAGQQRAQANKGKHGEIGLKTSLNLSGQQRAHAVWCGNVLLLFF
jgi:hypothetical protein